MSVHVRPKEGQVSVHVKVKASVHVKSCHM